MIPIHNAFKGVRFGPSWQRKPDTQVSATFNRLNEENPELPIESIIEMTASHYDISPTQCIKALWG